MSGGDDGGKGWIVATLIFLGTVVIEVAHTRYTTVPWPTLKSIVRSHIGEVEPAPKKTVSTPEAPAGVLPEAPTAPSSDAPSTAVDLVTGTDLPFYFETLLNFVTCPTLQLIYTLTLLCTLLIATTAFLATKANFRLPSFIKLPQFDPSSAPGWFATAAVATTKAEETPGSLPVYVLAAGLATAVGLGCLFYTGDPVFSAKLGTASVAVLFSDQIVNGAFNFLMSWNTKVAATDLVETGAASKIPKELPTTNASDAASTAVDVATSNEPSVFYRAFFYLLSNQKAQIYYNVVLYLALIIVLCGLLATVAYLLSLSTAQDTEKRSEYECGFAPFDSATRLPFDVHFYLVGILFLIFDVEVALLFPWVLTLRTTGWFGFYLVLSFLFILSIGFLYEWKRGALIWPARYAVSTNAPSARSEVVLLSQAEFASAKKSVSPLLVVALPSVLSFGQVADFGGELATNFLSEFSLIAAICAALTFLAMELGRDRSKRALALETWSVSSWALLFTGLLVMPLLLGSASSYTRLVVTYGYFLLNDSTLLFKLLTLLCGALVLACSEEYLRNHARHTLEYSIFVALALFFMLLLVCANNMISSFFALVGFSLNLYILILYDLVSKPSREAGLKYFYLSTLSSGLFIYGAFLFYAAMSTGDFDVLAYGFASVDGTSKDLLRVGTLLLIFGLFFKLSAVPGHLWAVEVYEGSPTPVTAFFMLPVKVAVLSFFARMLSTALCGLSRFWIPCVVFAAVGSLIWGAFASAYERKLKRFLGYASINQIGFLLIGLCCDSSEGTRALSLYIFLYAITSAGFLLVFMYVRRNDGLDILYLSDFRRFGRFASDWLVRWNLAVFLFAMAGIPPLASFFGKFFVLTAAFQKNLMLLVITGLATSLISAFYYLRIIKTMFFERPETLALIPDRTLNISQPQRATLVMLELSLWTGTLLLPTIIPRVDALSA